MKILKKGVHFMFQRDLGIDLGTANILVYLKGEGIILNEPSVIAINDNGSIVAVGEEAKAMVGRTPGNISASRPLKDGVIADYETTVKMMKYFIDKSKKSRYFSSKPRVVVCAPTCVTSVQIRAYKNAAKQAGAKEVYIIEEPFAAAIGANLPVSEPVGSMIVDIGGGTTEVAIISLGAIVISETLKVGGDEMDRIIESYIKKKYNLLIGERTAEKLKINLGCALVPEEETTFNIRGRDIVSGLPKSLAVKSHEIHEALADIIKQITDIVKRTLEQCPPELSGDIIERGVVLTGGCALLARLAEYLQAEIRTPVFVAEDALNCVAIGTGRALENIAVLR